MSVATYDVATDALQVTPAAADFLKKQLDRTGKPALRVSVKESGCTGFMYVMDEVNSGEPEDLALRLENGITVYVDPASLPVLQGTRLEFEKEGVNRSIKFHNPNVTAACGCGESFSIN